MTISMAATTPPERPMLQYLLLDDLYELLDELDEFDEPTDPVAVSALISAILDLNPVAASEGEVDGESVLYTHLRQFRDDLEHDSGSRISAEYMRDAVLVWIDRYQRKQRAALLSTRLKQS